MKKWHNNVNSWTAPTKCEEMPIISEEEPDAADASTTTVVITKTKLMWPG